MFAGSPVLLVFATAMVAVMVPYYVFGGLHLYLDLTHSPAFLYKYKLQPNAPFDTKVRVSVEAPMRGGDKGGRGGAGRTWGLQLMGSTPPRDLGLDPTEDLVFPVGSAWIGLVFDPPACARTCRS